MARTWLKLFVVAVLFAHQATAATPTAHLPRFRELVRLSTAKRTLYLQAFQAALLEMDHEVRPEEYSSLFDSWITDALAETSGPDFCINLGVVKELKDCDQKQGRGMHDFDTTPLLSPLGPAATQCKSGTKPCSPAFGFDTHGNLFCSGKNLTRDCEQKSKGGLPLADVISSCASGSPGKARVDCKAVASFYDQQAQLVEEHCKNSPATKACGILRSQLVKIAGDLKANEKITRDGPEGTPDAGKKLAELVSTVNQAAGQGTTPPEVPCAPEAQVQTSFCQPLKLADNVSPSIDNVLELLRPMDPKKTLCADVTLPNQNILTISKDGAKVSLSIKTERGIQNLALDRMDLIAMDIAGATLQKDPYQVPPEKLLSAYLPKTLLSKDEKMSLQLEEGAAKETFSARGWLTADGTKIRYVPVQSDDGADLFVGLTLPGAKDEKILDVSLGKQYWR